MRCPACKHEQSSVLDSRAVPQAEAIRRRRACDACAHRFTTYERVELQLPMVVKKDGQRQPFETAKLLAGIFKAVHRRPVSEAAVYTFGRMLEQRFAEAADREVTTQQVGDAVMAFLRDHDLIAYVRFATVYKDFADIQGLLREVSELAEGAPRSTASDAANEPTAAAKDAA